MRENDLPAVPENADEPTADEDVSEPATARADPQIETLKTEIYLNASGTRVKFKSIWRGTPRGPLGTAFVVLMLAMVGGAWGGLLYLLNAPHWMPEAAFLTPTLLFLVIYFIVNCGRPGGGAKP